MTLRASPRIVILSFIVIVGVAIGLGITFVSSKPNSHFTVTVTADGFDPSSLSVPKGATITWKNVDDVAHWPASNIHPTHKTYPGKTQNDCLGSAFDACRGLAKDETYTFTFNEVGSWDYHDHLRPAKGGTITVYDSSIAGRSKEFLKNIVASVKTWHRTITGSIASNMPEASVFRSFSFSEQTEKMTTFSNDHPEAAWKYLKDTFVADDGTISGNAHELAHIVGNNLYQNRGLEGIKVCDQTFAFGCIHGVTEQMLISEGPNVLETLPARCENVYRNADMNKGRGIGYTGCIHGIGHGLLSQSGLDLKESLSHCDTLPEEDRPYCYDGVFMEYSFSAPSSAFDENTPWEPCTKLAKTYQRNCARYQLTVFRSAFDFSPSEKAAACRTAPTTTMQEVCSTNFGFSVAQNNPQSVSDIQDQCGVFQTTAAKHRCIIGAAGELIFQEYTNWKENSAALCEALPEKPQERCKQRNASIAAQYNRM